MVAGLAVVLLDEGVAEWLFFAVLIGAAAVLRVSTMGPASSIASARPAFPCSSREITRRLLDDYVRRPPPGVARPAALDPSTDRVVATIRAGRQPQHIVPSWDLRTLWVLDNSGNDVFPIDPTTARAGRRIHVDDPYNLYFTPDGSSAIVVAATVTPRSVCSTTSCACRSALSVTVWPC